MRAIAWKAVQLKQNGRLVNNVVDLKANFCIVYRVIFLELQVKYVALKLKIKSFEYYDLSTIGLGAEELP